MPPGGAKGMIEDGVLDGVDHVLGTHVMTNMEPGKVFYRPENVQTGRSYFKLTIQGEGGHGSSPHTQMMRLSLVLTLLLLHKQSFHVVLTRLKQVL